VNGAGHSKPRPVPHCRVLSPGEFNGVKPEPLINYSLSLMMLAVTGFPQCCHGNTTLQQIRTMKVRHSRHLLRNWNILIFTGSKSDHLDGRTELLHNTL